MAVPKICPLSEFRRSHTSFVGVPQLELQTMFRGLFLPLCRAAEDLLCILPCRRGVCGLHIARIMYLPLLHVDLDTAHACPRLRWGPTLLRLDTDEGPRAQLQAKPIIRYDVVILQSMI
eukprot:scaffold28228_cov37-Tisochrysis_lutea.AAC.2